MSKNPGKIFEEDIQKSAKRQDIFFHRIKDLHIPYKVRMILAKHNLKLQTSKNEYDNFIYHYPYLLPVELKSTQSKSLNFDKIEDHQIENLLRDHAPDKGRIAGIIINFRSYDNGTFYVPIDKFNTYKNVAEGKDTETSYINKINKSSIPLGICQEIGIEIPNAKKRTRYFYDIEKMIGDITNRYSNRTITLQHKSKYDSKNKEEMIECRDRKSK